MRSSIVTEDVRNSIIMRECPIESIARLIDFHFPYLVANLLNIIEDMGVDGILVNYDVKNRDEINKTNWQEHLPELFWAVAAKENVFDYMFFNDYYLYVNFFLQYPRISGRKMHSGQNCMGILEDYKQMELSGSVYRFIDEVEYLFIHNDDSDEVITPEDEILYEISHIEETIEEYKKKSLLYRADAVSEEKGQVTLKLKSGEILTGVSDGIAGVYHKEGYDIYTALTLIKGEMDIVFVEEEEIEEILE